MTLPIPVIEPHARPGMIAVMAMGESMLPAGIGHMHICFCDPNVEPMPGECVYVACTDYQHALKVFLGKGEAAGYETKEGFFCLRGWSDKDSQGNQKDFILQIHEKTVKLIAPVVYIQRRM